MAAGAGLMARPKKTKKTAAPPASEPERPTVMNLKGTPEYADWLEGVHRKTYIPKAQIVRLALALWAEKNGHPAPPEI
jgi:hypothetical protein